MKNRKIFYPQKKSLFKKAEKRRRKMLRLQIAKETIQREERHYKYIMSCFNKALRKITGGNKDAKDKG